LKQPTGFITQIKFAMCDASACAHNLYITSLGPASIAQAIFMRDRAFADIGDDFHIVMRMRRKSRSCGNFVVIPNPDIAPIHPSGIIITGKAKMMIGVEPAMIGFPQGRKTALFGGDTVNGEPAN
jgi:hypothetical protein